MTRDLDKRWLQFTFATGAALALWALAAVHGYAGQTIWLPAAIAGAAWPSHRSAWSMSARGRLRRHRRGRT